MIICGSSAAGWAQIWNGWGPGTQYDHGLNPEVAVYEGTVVDVHNGTDGAGPLWYKVGQIKAGAVSWNNSHEYNSYGFNPSVAISGSTVVEVHNSGSGAGPLYYTVGQVNGSTITWGTSYKYDHSGFNPMVAIAGSTVVEVHNGTAAAGPLWYRVGQLNGTTINWSADSYQYDTGWNPSVAATQCVTDQNTSCGVIIVEAHNGSGSAGPMWYHTGTTSGGPQIQWQGALQYDWGWNPKIALMDGAYLLEVHNGNDYFGPMWYHDGVLNYDYSTSTPSADWGSAAQYDYGYNPSVAASDFFAVEVHNGTAGFGPLWYHLGTYSILE